MKNLAALGICYFAVLAIALLVIAAQHVARYLARRRYRARVVTVGPTIWPQQHRPIARSSRDMPPGLRVDPIRTRRSRRSTLR